ncbi:MAG: hypothetical protein JST79_19310 [Acidobacteria bacterium]|jgi:hypothetical protein|nr:hypothetical protein [Acidobacteriota bacterium]
MSTGTDNSRTTHAVQSLIHLLKTRSYEEIRQRMYDNPPGTVWWSACKTELDVRNGEQMASAALGSARVVEKMKATSERLEGSSDKLLQSTAEIAEMLKGTRETGRRVEIATYVMVAVAVLQLFYIAFQLAGKK